ncbi:uncharacterized protein K441DRAFT_373993 [Cenococcum geophilum 1.58]|uniref:Uncharacterized protein n=1 Tax=Cenococcum geophilum 1.58 TaxID=794803 RepID=A0ACC8ELX0_9PEZI|nr:hypothetical protein K441DRAFT_373993 [Cenococcum geophilum 1.58]
MKFQGGLCYGSSLIAIVASRRWRVAVGTWALTAIDSLGGASKGIRSTHAPPSTHYAPSTIHLPLQTHPLTPIPDIITKPEAALIPRLLSTPVTLPQSQHWPLPLFLFGPPKRNKTTRYSGRDMHVSQLSMP